MVLPADYVREHVELAYATTAYRAQGRTVATAHALVSPTTTREVLYVSATRGREANRLYVDTCFDPDPPTSHPGWPGPRAPRAVLAAVLAREGAEPLGPRGAPAGPARGGVFRRAGRRVPDHRPGRPTTALRRPPRPLRAGPERTSPRSRPARPTGRSWLRSGMPKPEASTSRPRYRGWPPPGLWTEPTTPSPSCTPGSNAGPPPPASKRQASAGLIAGLVPRALGVDDEDLARALQERDRAMERRARELAEQALAEGQAWARSLGPAPAEAGRREAWLRAVSTVAAFRDRWELALTRAPSAPKVLLPPWRGLRTVAAPKRRPLGLSDWPTGRYRPQPRAFSPPSPSS